MTDDANETITKAEAVALVEAASKKAFDAGHAAGAAGAQPEGEYFTFSNRAGLTKRVDVANENYEAELKVLISELRSQGVRNFTNHQSVRALQARHQR